MKPFSQTKAVIFLLSSIFVLSTEILSAQSHTLSGKITDKRNHQALSFVNVIVNDGQTGGISDIDGKYAVTSTEPITKVKFSSIGYETEEIVLPSDTRKLNITLMPMTIELNEVTVEAGENPAHRIIDSLVAHRNANNPNSLSSYHYKMYDQMVITIDSSGFGQALAEDTYAEKANLRMFDNMLKKSDLMVMETVSEVYFKSPNHKLQNVLGTKVSGMKDPTFIYLVSSMQSVSFYDKTINITGTDYVNPISQGSKQHYFFTLEAVEPQGQGDSLYIVSFHPRKGSTFNGLRGTLAVHSDGWALQSVKATPNEQSGMFVATIQQLYEKVEGHWFPKQLNTNISFPDFKVDMDGNTFPMIAVGKSYLTDIEINPEISSQMFSEIETNVSVDAGFRDDAFWDAHRIDSLTERIRATYFLVDSLTNVSNIFDRVIGLTSNILEKNTIPVGPINIDLNKVINLSGQRGWYFGMGLSTNDRLSRWFSLYGYGGYWTRLREFDYGGGLRLFLYPKRQMELQFQYSKESKPIGEFGGLLQLENSSLLSEPNYKYQFFNNIHTPCSSLDFTFSTRMARHFKVFVNLSNVQKQYNTTYYYDHSSTLTEGRFTNAEVKVRFAYNEKFISTTQGLQSLGTTAPIVWFSYMHSFPNILGGQFEFDRFKFEVSKNFYTKYWGVSKVILQAGYASETCPVMETFDIMGSYGRSGLYAPGSFNTMRMDEFFCDRFAALYLSHNFSGMLWKTNSPWFKPELTLATNIGWGDMKRAEAYPDKNFKTMEKGYFESGFVVNGLLNLPLVKVGGGVFYRYGPYAFDNVWNNFSWRWCATFSL